MSDEFIKLYNQVIARPELVALKQQNPFLYECIITRFSMPVPTLGKIPMQSAANQFRCHIAIYEAILKETKSIWTNTAHMQIIDILGSLFDDEYGDIAMDNQTLDCLPHVALVGYDVYRDEMAQKKIKIESIKMDIQ